MPMYTVPIEREIFATTAAYSRLLESVGFVSAVQ